MSIDPEFDSTRRFSAAEVKRLLGIAEPTIDRLFARARTVLGPDRADLCLDLARQAPLTRRWVPTGAIAALIVGTQELGREWWTRPHEELVPSLLWAVAGVPDNVLMSLRIDPELEDSGSCLAALGSWITDDAANKKWGRPVDRVDLADPRVDGRVGVPAGARAGDRLTAIISPGGRVWVDVVDRSAATEPVAVPARGWPAGSGRSPLGTRLAERTYHEAAQVRSAWTIATATGPLRLPGEIAGRASDPFSSPIDHDSSRRIYDWAIAHGVTPQQLGGPWRTKDALWAARHRIGLPYGRPGPWVDFDDAVAAAVDGDRGALMEALAALER
jgi:hypothetical protein